MQAGGPAVSPRPAPTAAGNPTAPKLATHAIMQHAVAWCVLRSRSERRNVLPATLATLSEAGDHARVMGRVDVVRETAE